MSYEIRYPEALMLAPIEYWAKAVWLAAKSYQGQREFCSASLEKIGERAIGKSGKPMTKSQVSKGLKILEDYGFIKRISARQFECISNPEKLNYDEQKVSNSSTLNYDERCTMMNEKLNYDEQKVSNSSTPSNKPNKNQTKTNTVGGVGGKTRKSKTTRFKPPTLEEIRAYAKDKNYIDCAAEFLNHFETVGWVYGKSRHPIKDWHAAYRQWVNREAKWGNVPSATNGEKKVFGGKVEFGFQ